MQLLKMSSSLFVGSLWNLMMPKLPELTAQFQQMAVRVFQAFLMSICKAERYQAIHE